MSSIAVPPRRRPGGLTRPFVVLALSSLFSLLLAEAAVRVAFRGSVDFDMEMWKYATQVKVPVDDPRVVHEHRAHARATLMGVEVTTNALGLRESVERQVEKPRGTFRVVALGDSITMGWGVPQELTYPAQLERLLNERPPARFPGATRFEVLNLGIGNYNTVQEVMRLQRVGLGLDPDFVSLGYFINDAEPTPRPSRGFLIEHSYLYALLASRTRFLGSATGDYRTYYRGLYRDEAEGWLGSVGALAELGRATASRGIPASVFLIPELHDLSASYPFRDIHAKIAAAGRAAGLPVVDLLPGFEGYSPETALWVTPLDAHHNAEGQARIARGIYDAIATGLDPRTDRGGHAEP